MVVCFTPRFPERCFDGKGIPRPMAPPRLRPERRRVCLPPRWKSSQRKYWQKENAGMKILALDNLQKVGLDDFAKEGIEADVKGKMTSEELAAVIDNYDGVVVRGATKATAMVFEKVSRVKVIGRAGGGTDNIDKVAATKTGVVVMNTPGGNTVTTGEHAIALMMALARQLPQADASMKQGKWEKNKFMGTELTDKALGVVGLGNIGKVVVERALGLKMVVIGYDPYVSKEDAGKLGA